MYLCIQQDHPLPSDQHVNPRGLVASTLLHNSNEDMAQTSPLLLLCTPVRSFSYHTLHAHVQCAQM